MINSLLEKLNKEGKNFQSPIDINQEDPKNYQMKIIAKSKIKFIPLFKIILFMINIVVFFGLLLLLLSKKNIINELTENSTIQQNSYKNKITNLEKELNQTKLELERSIQEHEEKKEEKRNIEKEKEKKRIGKVNPFLNIDLESKSVFLLLPLVNDNYKLIITKGEKGNIIFIVDQEENLSTKYYFGNFTVNYLQKLGSTFITCDNENKIINRFKYIVNEKEKGNNYFDIFLKKEIKNEIEVKVETELEEGTMEILSFTLSEETKNVDELNMYLIDYIRRLKDLFDIGSLSQYNEPNTNLTFKNSFRKSNIIKNVDDIIFIRDYIEKVEEKNITFELLYKSSRDGDNRYSFHKLCDNISPILVIIKTREKAIFGGYTTLPVNVKGRNYDNKAFIYNIKNKKIYKIKKGNYAINNINRGIQTLIKFGDIGDVIFVGDGFLSTSFSICEIDQIVYDGMTTNYEINNGEKYYRIVELEIYKVSFD